MPEKGAGLALRKPERQSPAFEYFLLSHVPLFGLSAAHRLLVLKKSQRETSCNLCPFNLLKFSLGQHPSLRTPGAGLILRPQRRVPSLLGRAQTGWLLQVGPSPAPVSPCPGMVFPVWHFFFVTGMPGDLGGASFTPCLCHWVSKGWRFGEPPPLLVFHGITSRVGHLKPSSLLGLYGRNGQQKAARSPQ